MGLNSRFIHPFIWLYFTCVYPLVAEQIESEHESSDIILRKRNKTTYASVLTLLWVLVMVNFALDWRYHRAAFVIHNDSPLDIAEAVGGIPDSFTIVMNTISNSCNWFADALLVCPNGDHS